MHTVKISKRDIESENYDSGLKIYLTINYNRAAPESVKQTQIESILLLVVCIQISLSSGCIINCIRHDIILVKTKFLFIIIIFLYIHIYYKINMYTM